MWPRLPVHFSLVVALGCPALLAASPAEAKSYKGAEVYSRQTVLYGRMEMRMRMIRGSGLLSTFFTYKDGSEKPDAFWEEIDLEVFGKDDAKSWQSNIISGNPKSTSEEVHPMDASLADDYHTYTVEWTPDYVAWSVDGVLARKTEGDQSADLTTAESLRFNVWSSESEAWVGEFDESALPAYQFVNWIKYYRYENGEFVLDWTDDFDKFDTSRWAKGNWTFDTNRVDFVPANAIAQDGALVLAITREGETGFKGTVPTDSQGGAGVGAPSRDAGTTPEDAGTAPKDTGTQPNDTTKDNSSSGGCTYAPHGSGGLGLLLSALALVGLARRRRAKQA